MISPEIYYRKFAKTTCVVFVSLCFLLVGQSPVVSSNEQKETAATGIGNFTFSDPGSDMPKPITVWFYRPQYCKADSPIVFVMHGVHRDAERYLNDWMPYADRYNFLIVCPEFDLARFPTKAYQCGNIFDEANQPVLAKNWTFTAIENIFDSFLAKTGNTSKSYYIYGHSAGGQFVHRFVLFSPNARYARAIAANPGWYTMPVYSGHKFPYGLKDSNLSESNLKASLSRDFVLMLGDKDTDPNDPDLRQTASAEEQGATRFERGQNYMKAAMAEASLLGARFNWRVQTIPGAHHSDAQIAPAAAAALFAK